MSRWTLQIGQAGSTVVTDLGRPRGPRLGASSGGALDQYSARIANVLVGNLSSEPLLEVTALDIEFVCDVDVLIAVAGAPMTLTVDGVVQPFAAPVSVQAGRTVALRNMAAGLRAYVAVHGSFEVPMLLGSCAPDTVLGFGRHLVAGDELVLRRTVAPVVNPTFEAALYRLEPPATRIARGAITVEVTDGPDVADFAGTSDRLFAAPFMIAPASNHIGLRLRGPLPVRTISGEMLSRGVPVGAVEVPPGDELLILHRGRGVTAGYPVLAVVTATGLNVLAQTRPGDRVSFRHVSLSHAVELARAERGRLAALACRVAGVFTALGVPHLLPHERTRLQ